MVVLIVVGITIFMILIPAFFVRRVFRLPVVRREREFRRQMVRRLAEADDDGMMPPVDIRE